MKLFRNLTSEEENGFRKWAQENYVLLSPIKGIWHPIVQAECAKMNAENCTEEEND